jgi:predicted DCC family thiol-disulfide oxidoreductase YuxK
MTSMKPTRESFSLEAIVWPLTVYFDGSCRLCRSEIDNLAARDTHNRLQLIDCSDAAFNARGLPHTREEMMNAIHARDASGTWVRGVDVFIACYAAADLGFISRALAHPGVKPKMAALYPWVARNRFWLSKLGIDHIMNGFAARARRQRARHAASATEALEQSRACVAGECEPANPGGKK